MTAPLLEAADRQFAADTRRFRRELLAHCYRMAGSAHDAEDLVQETYLRAWRAYAGFEGRASIRSWLYRIATNVCLTALESRRARVLPSGLAGPYEGPDRPPSQVAPGEGDLRPRSAEDARPRVRHLIRHRDLSELREAYILPCLGGVGQIKHHRCYPFRSKPLGEELLLTTHDLAEE